MEEPVEGDRKNESEGDFRDLIKEHLEKLGSRELTAATLAATRAGLAIRDDNKEDRGRETEVTSEKADQYVGHHAIVTKDDFVSQKIILENLNQAFPDSYFITEEKPEDLSPEVTSKVLNGANYLEHLNDDVWGIDPVDGSSQKASGGPEWSVSVGMMRGEEHTVGAIFAPDIRGGQLVFGEKGKGVWVSEYGRPPQKVERREKEDKDLLIYMGVDVCLDPKFNNFVNEVANDRRTRTVKTDGSCPQGLAMVVLGRVDAFIQPTQRVWDWFGALPLLEEVGMKMQFYRFVDGQIVMVGRPTTDDYDPSSRNLGFVCGLPGVVNRIFTELQNKYG